MFTRSEFDFPYEFESSPLGLRDLQQCRSSYYHAGGPVSFVFMAQSQLRGYDVRIGERSTVREVPGNTLARIEQA